MSELIKCDCGSEAQTIHYSFNKWQVICMYYGCYEETELYDTEAEAIEAWNKRSGENK